MNKPLTINAYDLRPGTQIMHGDVTVTILAATVEPYEDRFGQKLSKMWARREDTGVEGWFVYGPSAVFDLA